ncbi:SdrH family protein, partial [Staphylococcus sp. NAM3COL9]|uniref:SdrH family protein n=1 Tax=Staphylococcus sp. NAM3COL9 TaxID=1667172 RepID=UPI0020A28514
PNNPQGGGGNSEEKPKPEQPSEDGDDNPTKPSNPNNPQGGGGNSEEKPKPEQPSEDGDDNPTKPSNPNNPQGGGGNSEEKPKPEQPSEDGDDNSTEPSNPDKTQNGEGSSTEKPKPEQPSEGREDNATESPKPNKSPNPNIPSESIQQNQGSKSNSADNSVNHSNSVSSKNEHTSSNLSNGRNQNTNKQYAQANENIAGDNSNDTTYGDLTTEKKSQSSNRGDSKLVNRFNQMSTGSFKYNPFILNQVKQLNNNVDSVSDKDISSIIRRQSFADNSFLNELQKGTNYFKFQYFNPLKSRNYYKNLDKQVLALITGEIGSMPDLKTPENKSDTSGKYEYHSSSDEEMTHTNNKKSKDTIDIKFERTLFALITAITMIFIGIVVGYFVYRRNKKEN